MVLDHDHYTKSTPPTLKKSQPLREIERASRETAATPLTPESTADAFCHVTEELTALRAIVEAASHGSGEEYFQALVRNLAHVVESKYALVAEFASPDTQTTARTIAFGPGTASPRTWSGRSLALRAKR
jgi:hypothetical protein